MSGVRLAIPLVLTLSALPVGAQVVAIKAGKILPLNGPAISNGVILTRGGRIVAVGRDVRIPAGAKVIDATGKVVIPGLIAPLTRLADRAETDVAVTPEVRAVDSFDFYGDYDRLLESGLTSCYIAAGARRLVSGQGGVVKLAGASEARRTLKASADVRVVLGDPAKSPPSLFRPPIPPTTENPILPAQRQLGSVRPSQLAVLRQLLADARRAGAQSMARAADRPARRAGGSVVTRIAANSGAKTSSRQLRLVAANPKIAALEPVLAGERPLRFVVHTAGDIRKALAFAEEQKVRIVIEGGTESYKVAGELAQKRVPVVLESTLRIGKPMADDLTRKTANGQARLDTAAILSRAGVRVALAPADDADLADLLMLAAYQVQAGASRDAALRMVTSNGAEALGVTRRLGAIAPGRDADLVVLSGDPLDSRSRVEMTLVDGAIVYKRPAPASAGGAVAIRAGRILTATQGEIENGVIVVRGGKIVSVTQNGIAPAGMPVIDASKSVVMPGMIDAHSHLGLHADAEPAPLEPSAATTGAASGRTRLLNALKPGDPAFDDALRSGVTTILLAPPTAGQICGQAALLKTVPGKERVVKELAALCFNTQGGSPRMAQVWSFREVVQRAKDYLQRRSRYEQERANWERDAREAEAQKKLPPAEPAEVAKDEDQEPFAALFRKEIPALVHANRMDEITTALTIFRAEADVNMVLMDAADGDRAADSIRKHGAPAALGPVVTRREDGKVVNRANALADAGVPVVFHSSATSGTALLRLNAADAVRNGMDPHDALKALTINAARALNVESRLGSIEPGKDADLVILSGDPFDMTSRVQRVLVNGKEAYRGK